MPVWVEIIIIIGVAFLAALIGGYYVYRRSTGKLEYMFDAFEDGEINFHFKETNRFNRSLNRLRGIYEKRKIAHEQESWSKLIRVLTHEIMNTLTPVVSLSDALVEEVKEKEEKKEGNLEEGLEIISESSRNLMEFVSNYRRVTGIAKPVRKPVDLEEIIDDVFKLNQQILTSCSVELKFSEEHIPVHADSLQIKQVIQNLIKNSIESGATRIEVTLKNLQDGTSLIWFKNNGEPIPYDLKDRIFIPFFTTKKSGSGIGLSVCRQIMRFHKGSIDLLRSTPEETVFELQFN